ncbi:hypothetical protein L6452_30975 [Arctium lappa]|uniref:Uncharacterized protein n=1 Tax=Arctium lappa TaxID=4217 RepID=A0ACB8ZK49_ARCLA|nr:hypothetical protein L6452_30975 [Arctium lappa]
MWYLDSGCSKDMTGQKDILSNYTEKFCGNVRFENDQFSPILGYGDVIHDKVTITKVRYVEGLGHNLFSIGKFCDKGLEVNLKAKSCSVRTEDRKKLLVGTRKSNLYTINLSKVQTDNEVLCTKRQRELEQVGSKADEGIFISYSQTSAVYKVYLKKSKIVVERVNVTFNKELDSEQHRSKLPKSVVIDRHEESTSHHPITSDMSTETVPPVQEETPIQITTPTVEDVHDIVETEVADSVSCTEMTIQQPEIVVPTEASAHNTSTDSVDPSAVQSQVNMMKDEQFIGHSN